MRILQIRLILVLPNISIWGTTYKMYVVFVQSVLTEGYDDDTLLLLNFAYSKKED